MLRSWLRTGCTAPVLFLVEYKKEEQSKRFAVDTPAAILSGVFGGLLAAGIIDSLEGSHGIIGWKWLFVIISTQIYFCG